MAKNCMNRAEGGVDIEVEHIVPGVRVAIGDGTADIRPCVGVEDVEIADKILNAGQHGRDTGRVQQVDQDCADARCDHLARAGQADTGCAPSDCRALAFKFVLHRLVHLSFGR